MPGNRLPIRPAVTLEPDCSDDSKILEQNIQRQLYDDVARIFDESIFCDTEVVCGKLKLLTHSCILKARTNNFYHKLQSNLHINIERSSYDEIYSFISDVYTECDIKLQEEQIISYLNNKCLNQLDTSPQHKEDIQNNVVDKELIEEDVLSNAFKTFLIKDNLKCTNVTVKHNKPTTLSLRRTYKPIKHSKSCDIIQHSKPSELLKTSPTSDCFVKSIQNNYISDNLIEDHRSDASTSEVLLNVTFDKMTNIYQSTDSGLEKTGLLESLSSQKTPTLTDVSLTESNLCDLLEDPTNNAQDSIADNNKIINAPVLKIEDKITYDSACDGNLSINEQIKRENDLLRSINPKTGKPRSNIEIVFLESSFSNPWKSVYSPKLSVKEACETFAINECLHSNQDLDGVENSQSKSYFIDAANLADDPNNPGTPPNIKETSTSDNESFKIRYRPLPSWSNKLHLSPTELSDTKDNLENSDTYVDSFEKELFPPKSINAEQGDKSNKNLNNSAVNKIQKADSIVHNNELMTSTPNNSIMFLNRQTHSNNQVQEKATELNNSTRITGQNCSKFFYLTKEESATEDGLILRGQIDDVPIISGAYTPKIEEKVNIKSPKPTNMSSWIVDMSSRSKLDTESSSTKSLNNTVMNTDQCSDSLKKESLSASTSGSSAKSSHNYFIDFTKLPNTCPHNEKPASGALKNIFPLYVDIGETKALRKKTRLSSSSSVKKTAKESRDCSFEIYESLCNDPNISLSNIIKSETKSGPLAGNEADKTMEASLITLDPPPTLNKIQKPVKLADLENSYPKLDILSNINNEDTYDVRMTRSIPDNNWRERDPVSRSRGSQRILSFHSENATSLNRLFPNLKKELSKSMPGSLSSATVSSLRFGYSPTPGESQEHISELSHSSIQSAGGRSAFENSTTEDNSLTSSILKNCQSRLGQDLLRMFIEEIAPDVIVEVDGIKIKAHKCILSSRCQYFAAILSGTWVESAGNVITLPPFSYNVVHFALCHIYAGIAVLPKCINIVELATVADMLCLESLKEVIMHKLKDKYCHNFHMPCVVCTAGVLECFSLSWLYGLDDLYRKCLQWITKYFSKIWPTRYFGLLTKDLLDKCYQQQIINMSMDNLFETVYGCGLAASALEASRSVETVQMMCRRLTTAAAQFAAPRLEAVLRAASAVPPDAPEPALAAIHECVDNAIEWAPPEEACRAYAFLSALLKDIHDRPNSSSQVKYDNFLHANASKWCQLCERQLVSAAPRVVVTQAFKDLSLNLRKRLRELGCIKYGARPKLNVPTHVQDVKKKNSGPSSSATLTLDIDHVRTSFIPYTPKPIAAMTKGFSNSNTEFHGHGKIPLPKVRTTKTQEERAKYNMMKSQQTYNRSGGRGPIRASSLSNVKSRVTGKEERKPSTRNPSSRKPVGGSESGRVGARPRESSSQDSLATSSRPRTGEPPPPVDSLTQSQNNKYATFTKSKSPKTRPPQEKETKSSQQKTRIPVYLNQKVQKCEKQTSTTRNVCNTNKTLTSNVRRNFVGSLMNATKSSSAKIVPKVVKEQNVTPKRSKDNSMNKSESKGSEKNVNVPGIERSETFLKDEPTFGDKTTQID